MPLHFGKDYGSPVTFEAFDKGMDDTTMAKRMYRLIERVTHSKDLRHALADDEIIKLNT